MKKILFLLFSLSIFSCQKSEENLVFEKDNFISQNRIAITTAKQNTIDTLIAYGIWSKLDMFQMRVDTNLTNAVYYSDWKDTSRHPVSYGTIGAFYVNGGIKGSTTYRINTMYNPTINGVNFTQDNNSFGVYVGNRVIENKTDLSALQTGSIGNQIQCTSTTPSLYGYDNNSTQTTQANDLGRGFHAVKRTASNSWTTTQGGYKGANTFTTASSTIQNQPFWEYCSAVNTTCSKYTTRTHYYIFAGSGDIDLFLMNKIIEKEYLLPLGLCPTKRITFVGNSFVANRDFPQQTLASLNDYNNLDINIQGVAGQTTQAMLTHSQLYVFPFTKDYLTNDVYVVCELTNTMATNGGSATATYNYMVNYCDSLRAHVPNAYIIVNTMLPRNGQVNRQNDSNLNDTIYLNGMVRVKLVRDGHADEVCDVASDTIIGRNGQNLNSTYYKDPVHLNFTGNTIYKTYVTNSILNGL